MSAPFVMIAQIQFTIEGKDAQDAEEHIDKLLDAGAIQDVIAERFADHELDAVIIDVTTRAWEPEDDDDDDDEVQEGAYTRTLPETEEQIRQAITALADRADNGPGDVEEGEFAAEVALEIKRIRVATLELLAKSLDPSAHEAVRSLIRQIDC